MNEHSAPVWAVLPAAGTGQRMQSTIPKQYLDCMGEPVLKHSIQRLLSVDRVRGAVIALHPDDEHWQRVRIESDKPVHTLTGGSERADSVRLALQALQQIEPGADTALALVHDAVRPCVDPADIDRLIDAVIASGSGGILATRVKDTMKRADRRNIVEQTVDRDGLWHALTPQLFAAGDLLRALQQASDRGTVVTDEASAMEAAGHDVQLIESSDINIKITRPDDLRLAAFYLSGER